MLFRIVMSFIFALTSIACANEPLPMDDGKPLRELKSVPIQADLIFLKCSYGIYSNHVFVVAEYKWPLGKEPKGFRYCAVRKFSDRAVSYIDKWVHEDRTWHAGILSPRKRMVGYLLNENVAPGDYIVTAASTTRTSTNRFDVCTFTLPEIPGVTAPADAKAEDKP